MSALDCDFNRSMQHPDTVSVEGASPRGPSSDSLFEGPQARSTLIPGGSNWLSGCKPDFRPMAGGARCG